MDNTKGIGKPQGTPSVKSGKNYFLGVGINDYSAGWTILNNAVRDVERIAQILSDKYDFHTIDILTNDKATRLGILRQLRALQTLTADDSLLIYYSGHGHLAKEDGYWIPVNADAEDIDNYIPNAQLRGLIRAIPTRHTLLIADSCYSGSFFPESETKNMRGAADELEKYRSRWAFCSGRHDQKVSDGTAGTHSPFAEALITELERNSKQKVFIQELAIPVIDRTSSKYRQLPKVNVIFDCGDDGGQFVFSLKIDEADDVKEWRLLDKTSVWGLEEFVKKYPLSKFGVDVDKLIIDLNHEIAWQQAQELHNETSYSNYLLNYPNGKYIEYANSYLRLIEKNQYWEKTLLEKERLLKPKKTILFMGTIPPGTEFSLLEIEFSRISRRLDNQFILAAEFFLSGEDMPELIAKYQPNIIHFSNQVQNLQFNEQIVTRGIRNYIPKDDVQTEGFIVYDSDMRGLIMIDTIIFEHLINSIVDEHKAALELVIFNNCYTESLAIAIGKFVPYVIMLPHLLDYKLSLAFNQGFYFGIGNDKSIEKAFVTGKMSAVLRGGSKAKDLVVLYKNGVKMNL